MKLVALCVSLICASLSFGQQSSLYVDGPHGPIRLSANSISGGTRENASTDLEHLKLAVLHQQLTHLESTYTAEHPKVKQLKAQISLLEVDTLLKDMASRSNKEMMQLKGNVEIKTDTMTLTADEADYDPTTGEIAPRGTVRVKLNPK